MSDGDWQEAIYRQHRRSLFLTAWNVLHCPDLAEDAVQATFVQLARLAIPPNEPRIYVFKAVRNAAIDIARNRQRRNEVSVADRHNEPSHIEHSATTETLDEVSAALARLDGRSREVVELHLHGGLTFAEIALLLDEPLATVASRYRRSLEKLRHLLDVYHG